ncbi:MAG: aldo/keto reductase [Deltaproteobacteria bacterium]|jgi:diketogulonate reductase-like aldo/keto reductase|nr:aldo/keto reductase [Deltaproteobacteria bacterium]
MALAGAVELSPGLVMPRFGLGLWGPREGLETERAVAAALEAGYRLFDSAPVYQNEKSLGRALLASGLKREQYFIISKLWTVGRENFEPVEDLKRSLDNLGLDQLDLCLLHWPTPQSSRAWLSLGETLATGLIRALGVANFSPSQLTRLVAETGLWPRLWQMEIHPLRTQEALLEAARAQGVALMAHCPLARGRLRKNQILGRLAQKHRRSVAQIILRWAWQRGLAVIPKSTQPERIRENARIFDFDLPPADVAAISRLDQGQSVLKPPFVFDAAGYVLAHSR